MSRPIRVARIIARLNVGGPAIHVAELTARLPRSFESQLFVGSVAPGEREMVEVLEREGVRPVRVDGLGRAIRLGDDARALAVLLGALRRFAPDIVHTHTAKAGALGRIAARILRVPVVVHTFHGHVFDGYFSPLKTRAFIAVERGLARASDAIVAISPRQREDLVERYRVAPAAKVHMIPLGFDLAPLADVDVFAGQLRRELRLDDAPCVAVVGRLTAIKDHPLLFQAFERLATRAHLLVVGGGEDEDALRALARRSRAGERIHFLGFRSDLARVLADAKVVVLTSRNEGTPVALIEALAAGCTPVGVDVGGVGDVLDDGRVGHLVRARTAPAIAAALDAALNERPTIRSSTVDEWKRRAREKYGVERLVADHVALYNGLLRGREHGPPDGNQEN